MQQENMESKEPPRLDDPDFLGRVREAVAEGVEDLVTDPEFADAGFDIGAGDKIRRGEKVRPARMIKDRIVGTCEDLRLSRDEIDQVRKMFLEEPGEDDY